MVTREAIDALLDRYAAQLDALIDIRALCQDRLLEQPTDELAAHVTILTVTASP